MRHSVTGSTRLDRAMGVTLHASLTVIFTFALYAVCMALIDGANPYIGAAVLVFTARMWMEDQ